MTGERAERTKKSKYVAQSQRRKDRILNIQYSSPFQAMENVDEPVICVLFTKSKVGVREEAKPVSTSHTPSTRPTNQRVEINSYLQPIPLGPTINVTCLSSGAG